MQGVGFRMATLQEASKFPGLRGFVRNLEDGRVEAVFLGAESAVLAMVAWCDKGPGFAKVDSVELFAEMNDLALPIFGVQR